MVSHELKGSPELRGEVEMAGRQAQDGAQEVRPRSSPPHPAASPAAYFHSTHASLRPTHVSTALGTGQSAEGSENDL